MGANHQDDAPKAMAFLDESGDANIATEKGASALFSVAAVVLPASRIDQARERANEVRRRYFQTGSMKSSGVGSNHRRRLVILGALDTVDFQFMGLVVDKRRLDRESGLRFRSSFMKFVDHFVYARLFRVYPGVRVRADQHGSTEFMQGFERYLHTKRRQTNLFTTEPAIEFVDSRTDALVQVADFVAGSLRLAYSDDTKSEDARAILAAMARRSLGVHEWPAAARSVAMLESARADGGADALIARAALASAYAFLGRNEERDDRDTIAQLEVLQELLRVARFGEEDERRSVAALVKVVTERGVPDVSDEYLRRTVIAGLRDRDVLIVSSNKGYRLASSLRDIETHFERHQSEVRPILRRLGALNDGVRAASFGQVDPLRGPGFAYLSELFEKHRELEAVLPEEPGG